PRLAGAVREPDGGFVEHDVDARHGGRQRGAVAHVALHHRERRHALGVGEVLVQAAREVVEHDDLGEVERRQRVDAGGPDDAGAAGDEDPGAGELDHQATAAVSSSAARVTVTAAPSCAALSVAAVSTARIGSSSAGPHDAGRPSAMADTNSATTAASG